MFDDPKEELRRLERRLLEEDHREEPGSEEDWLEDAHDLLGPDPDENEEAWAGDRPVIRNYANGYGKAHSQIWEDPEDRRPGDRREKGLGGLVFLLLLEILGIAALAVYWLLVLL